MASVTSVVVDGSAYVLGSLPVSGVRLSPTAPSLPAANANVVAPETWAVACHQIFASRIVMPLPAGTPICTPAVVAGLM